MRRTFVNSVLSTHKRRQGYFYVRNLVAGGCGFAVYTKLVVTLGTTMAVAAGIATTIGAYFTVAPIIALLACLIEQMSS